ncbi:hypothetical protein Gotri_022133 [Gossypium trilobum]|uniref:Uncharacterized protein n=1 Tax=Gossypium trilobum TaxID=34281 RepID=A0A7J9DER0_9ROSI|nr:hypothetical protein [Gossypium trilobum]
MIPNIWIISSIKIQDYVSSRLQIKLQQNSFKKNRLLVQC